MNVGNLIGQGIGKSVGAESLVTSFNFFLGEFSNNIVFTRASTAWDTPNGQFTSYVSDIPRLGDGFLYEGATTNLFGVTEQPTQWTSLQGTTSTDNEETVLGGIVLGKIIEDSTPTLHFKGRSFAVTSGVTYCFSVYAKKGTDRWFQFSGASAAGWAATYINFDLETGTVGNNNGIGDSGIEDLGGGVYRCWATFTATATTTGSMLLCFTNNTDAATRIPSYAGNGTDYFLAGGVQVEVGNSPSSYIRCTTTTAVTRAVDNAQITLPYISNDVNFTFDDNTTQTITGVSSPYVIPTNLNRRRIYKMVVTEA
jgi:hypothetical protein